MKLLTPIARTRPSASSVSSALYAAIVRVELARQRLVQDQQVDLLDTELAGALLERVERLLVAVVADPDLRLDEHVARGRVPERRIALADLALVAVGGGGVDVR